jgi:hypothetical protein
MNVSPAFSTATGTGWEQIMASSILFSLEVQQKK